MSKSLVIQLNYNLVYFYYLLYCCTFSALLQEVGLENLLIKKNRAFCFQIIHIPLDQPNKKGRVFTLGKTANKNVKDLKCGFAD